ncbi:hypothetical protein [Streptomyces cadmiisoli]|uniref:hypothetical protein n=1 Tax=Streptomyces cadmiisoli TaxID=2184053 RepID=UPI003D703214
MPDSTHAYITITGTRDDKVTVTGSGGTWTTEYQGPADRFERLYLKRDLSALSGRTRDLVRECPPTTSSTWDRARRAAG